MSDKVFTKWKDNVNSLNRFRCKEAKVCWDEMMFFHSKIDKLMQDNNKGRLREKGILYRLFDPVDGLQNAMDQVNDWLSLKRTMQEICKDDKKRFFRCPEPITGENRLLSFRQDTMLLIVSMNVMYESLYKNVIDLLYDGTNHPDYKGHQTTLKAKYLAKEHGIDISHAVDNNLRNIFTHMSFKVDEENRNIKTRRTNMDAKEDLPPVYVGGDADDVQEYTYEKLLSIYKKMKDSLWPLTHAVVYWFEYNEGPIQLFDDAFYGTVQREKIRLKANGDMLKLENLDFDTWEKIVEDARHNLPEN